MVFSYINALGQHAIMLVRCSPNCLTRRIPITLLWDLEIEYELHLHILVSIWSKSGKIKNEPNENY
jgi:hypothetical protein